ncbi:MAG TPA: YdiU family protein [Steroidobacteraceae bacterium]
MSHLQESSYARLPGRFYARLDPTPVARPRLIRFNEALAAELGLDLGTADADTLAAMFSGNRLPPGVVPLAMAYAGHQFGYFVPQLGDGRAILLGEVRDATGRRFDVQLKGAGRTPFSRDGDGRAALGPVLREYLVSEAMHALGIPATRALAAVLTGESVQREQPLPGAILTRVAASHVRVGTFQYFAARADLEAIRRLADYVIERHCPEVRAAERPYLGLLQSVIERQARLIAHWMHVGFIHGVMNTDNMALSGETIDFGPCAFMDAYDPATVFSSIDSFGRYAYANQPQIAQWNLARFAETLPALIDTNPERGLELAGEAVAAFPGRYAEHWLAGMRSKLGLCSAEEGDRDLAQALLDAMHASQADFTLTFRRLADAAQGEGGPRDLLANRELDDWLPRWRSRLLRDPQAPEARATAMRRANPAFIPRNHRIEQIIRAALERDDFSPFAEMLEVLAHPYEEQPRFQSYAGPPQPSERVLQTFCGT